MLKCSFVYKEWNTIIKLISPVPFYFFHVAARNFKITYVTHVWGHIILHLANVALYADALFF